MSDTVAQGPRWTVDWARPGDETALLQLFARAFGHEMPPEQWHWKYGDLDPTGSLVRKEGRPVAFYGGMPRAIRYFGAPATAVQIGDVMVDPAERGVLTRHGPFFLVASAFAEHLVGPNRRYTLAYGFPSERHARLGERLGLYAQVDEVLEASWPHLPRRPNLALRTSPLTADRFDAVDHLWEEMAAALADTVVAARDSVYIQHRFLRHPRLAYTVLLVTRRLSGIPFGLLVLRDREADGLELLDAVAPPPRIPALLTLARRIAGHMGRHRVFAWLTRRAAQAFDETVALVPIGAQIPTIVWDASPDVLKVRDHWWLTGGDTDFR